MKNYYLLLGLSQQATALEIKKSYHELMRRHHPDKGGISQLSSELNTAYEVLTDPNSRANHDREIQGQPAFDLSAKFDAMNIHYTFLETPSQYTHYDYWNALLINDERFFMAPNMHDRTYYMGELMGYLLGKMKEEIDSPFLSESHLALLEANQRKLFEVSQCIFTGFNYVALYDHLLGLPLTELRHIALVEKIGGIEALKDIFYKVPTGLFFDAFLLLLNANYLTPALAQKLLDNSQKKSDPAFADLYFLDYRHAFGALINNYLFTQENLTTLLKSSRRSSHELRPLTPPYKRCRIRRFRLSFYQFEPMYA